MVTSPKAGVERDRERSCNDNEDPSLYDWTPEQVGVLMKKACSSQSGTTLLFTAGKIEPVGMAPGPTKVLHWAHRYLDRDHRQAVYIWGSAVTWRKNGISVAAFLREMGWANTSTIHRRQKRGLKIIAESLKRDRIPRFTF